MPRVRVHQHVNPLATYFRQLPVKPIEIEEIFANPELPLFVDIGAGRGRFLLQMAESDAKQNFLGLEIREPLVEEANEIAEKQNLTNLHYHFCNATLALDKLFAKLPENILETVTIQFPDPWFKKKHAKRRMVKDNLVETVIKHLKVSGKIFVQSDVEFLAEEIFEYFRSHENLREIEIDENPLSAKTEREISVENRDLPVYRRMFERSKD
jgi:tRNA (guanine-N7-)-methyltransferase